MYLIVVSPIVAVWSTVIVVLVGTLLFLHIILVSVGKTTQEFLKRSKTDMEIDNCSQVTIQHPTTKYRFLGLFSISCYHTLLNPMWEEVGSSGVTETTETLLTDQQSVNSKLTPDKLIDFANLNIFSTDAETNIEAFDPKHLPLVLTIADA